jgi:ABC-type glycerol-3-phosphate transport system substrate-binding protein
MKAKLIVVLAAMTLLAGPASTARAHDVRLNVRYELPAAQAAALVRVFDHFNHTPGHPTTVTTILPGAPGADVFIAAPESVAPGSVVPLDEFLDAETRAGYLEEALAAVTRDGLVIGLPLTADGTLAAFVARDTRFPRESFDLIQYLTGPVGGAMLAEVEGLVPAHRAATPAFESPR